MEKWDHATEPRLILGGQIDFTPRLTGGLEAAMTALPEGEAQKQGGFGIFNESRVPKRVAMAAQLNPGTACRGFGKSGTGRGRKTILYVLKLSG